MTASRSAATRLLCSSLAVWAERMRRAFRDMTSQMYLSRAERGSGSVDAGEQRERADCSFLTQIDCVLAQQPELLRMRPADLAVPPSRIKELVACEPRTAARISLILCATAARLETRSISLLPGIIRNQTVSLAPNSPICWPIAICMLPNRALLIINLSFCFRLRTTSRARIRADLMSFFFASARSSFLALVEARSSCGSESGSGRDRQGSVSVARSVPARNADEVRPPATSHGAEHDLCLARAGEKQTSRPDAQHARFRASQAGPATELAAIAMPRDDIIRRTRLSILLSFAKDA